MRRYFVAVLLIAAATFGLVFQQHRSPAQVLVNGQPPQIDQMQSQIDTLTMSGGQDADRTLDSSGNDTWTYPRAFAAPPRIGYFPQNSDVSGKPIVCNWQTRTATSVTYHCDKSSGTLASLLSPMFSGSSASGATITVIARGTFAAP